jgi:hypothetical protein
MMSRALAVIFGIVLAASQVQGGEDLGQFCWNFGGGLVDTLRLSVTRAKDHPNGPHASKIMYNVGIMWLTIPLYQMSGSGVVVPSYATDGMYHGGIHLSNYPTPPQRSSEGILRAPCISHSTPTPARTI